MKFMHTALRVSSSENATRFYEELLGLKLARGYKVDEELAKKLFGINQNFLVRLYKSNDMTLEVFISDQHEKKPRVEHVCLKVDDSAGLKKKAEKMGFKTVEIERKEKHNLVFIYDSDGNAFEIKE